MISIQVTGIKQAQIDLDKKLSPDKIKTILIRAGFLIEGAAKRKAPVDTGRLRASISTNWNGSGMQYGALTEPVDDSKESDGVNQPELKPNDMCVISVGSNVEYAPYLEFGTENQAPQPYLMPAYLENIGKIKAMIEYEIEK